MYGGRFGDGSVAYDPNCPVVCMDGQPVQLVKENRRPIRARPGHLRRYDYEYEGAGAASVFLFSETLRGWRQGNVREQRTAVDPMHFYQLFVHPF